MNIKNATEQDFDIALDYVEKIWAYNTYDKETVRKVYNEVVNNKDDFAFFLIDNGKPVGFAHGSFFNTFWVSGMTCYLSSLITNDEVRRKGYGYKLMDHVKKLADDRGCKAVIIDSGMSRMVAHSFFEKYGFEKCAYCFQLTLREQS